MTPNPRAAAISIALAIAAACGGTVVFEEPGETGEGEGAAGPGGTITVGPVATSSTGFTTSSAGGDGGGGFDPGTSSGIASASVITVGPGPGPSSGSGGPNGICETGLSTGDRAWDLCLEEQCCIEFVTCVQGGVDACIQCFDLGGPLCDDAIACIERSGCFDQPG
jgi:hypothetical protein